MVFYDILLFLSLFSSGIVAGVLVCVLVGMVPLFEDLPARTSLNLKQNFDPHVDRVNPPATAVAIASGVLILVSVEGLTSTARVFTLLGVVGSVGVGITSLAVNRPINKRMSTLPSESPPPEFGELMDRWTRAHSVRTLAGLLSFVGYVLAALSAID